MPKKFPTDLFYFKKTENIDAFLKAKQYGDKFVNEHPRSRYEITYCSDDDNVELWCDRFSVIGDFPGLFGPGDVPGYLSEGDIIAIAEISKMLPLTGTTIEVGAFLGKSAVEWAKNLKKQNKQHRIICIDTFNTNIEFLQQLIKDADFDVPPGNSQIEIFNFYTKKYKNIHPLQTNFDETFIFNSEDLCLVFEDSDHTFKTMSISLPFWYEKLITGGILSGHDYADDVKTAVDMFALHHNFTVHTFENSSIWYIIKQ